MVMIVIYSYFVTYDIVADRIAELLQFANEISPMCGDRSTAVKRLALECDARLAAVMKVYRQTGQEGDLMTALDILLGPV